MNSLINTHDLKELILDHEKSKIVTDVLKYQNIFLYCCSNSIDDIRIISISTYNERIYDADNNLTIINSSGVVLVLVKDIESGKFKISQEIKSNNFKPFEFFGKMIELSEDGRLLVITNTHGDKYLYEKDNDIYTIKNITNATL